MDVVVLEYEVMMGSIVCVSVSGTKIIYFLVWCGVFVAIVVNFCEVLVNLLFMGTFHCRDLLQNVLHFQDGEFLQRVVNLFGLVNKIEIHQCVVFSRFILFYHKSLQ